MAEPHDLPLPGSRRFGVAGLSFLAVVLAALSGCGDSACFQWSEAEGACPAQAEAKTYMTQVGPSSNNCGGVVSVDSDGEFDGTACCYDVSKSDTNQYCY